MESPRSNVEDRGLLGLTPAVTIVLLLVTGCASNPKPIFKPMDPPLNWPPAPATPRVTYVGQLGNSADLRRPRSFLQGMTDLFAGKEAPAPLYGPRDVLTTRSGQLVWIADPGGRCVHVFDLEKRDYRKIAMAGNDPLVSPVGLCVGPVGSILVCDSEAVAIHRYDEASGAFIGSIRLPAEIQRPVSMTYQPTTGSLFVVDVSAHDIKVLDDTGRILRILGGRGNKPGLFNYPSDIVDDGKMIWVADTGNQRVQGLDYAGRSITTFGQAGDSPGDLALPKSVSVDGEGNIYVVDGRFENIQVFSRSGVLLMFLGREGTGPGSFWLPSGMFIDSGDRIWVCDSYNHRVQVFDRIRQPTVPTVAPPRGDVTP